MLLMRRGKKEAIMNNLICVVTNLPRDANNFFLKLMFCPFIKAVALSGRDSDLYGAFLEATVGIWIFLISSNVIQMVG